MPAVSLQSDRKPNFNKNTKEITITKNTEEKSVKVRRLHNDRRVRPEDCFQKCRRYC